MRAQIHRTVFREEEQVEERACLLGLSSERLFVKVKVFVEIFLCRFLIWKSSVNLSCMLVFFGATASDPLDPINTIV